eukprot:CAMPEP_0118636666 /NCGR_PEP_ID=MMETSP0785-20121206/2747_1 /TAXON_ID=91992 /ORGANISM="Bolidomonas pacifica, Strain CCMP 1866" /LENGTH=336 /DNA_ID=CAMNT_0006527813 /DNA_START=18 /DNA_END=1024 /DNA_ORIENTATION=-
MSSSSSVKPAPRRPSALDLFKVRASKAPTSSSKNNNSSGTKALLRDDAPPLELPKPPPRKPVSAAFTGGYGRDKPKVTADRISQLAKPKYKPVQAAAGTSSKYNIGHSSEESDSVIWGGAPVPPVPPETSRRLSTTDSTTRPPTTAPGGKKKKAISLADMLLEKKKPASNPDPKPKWNHNFVDHESLPLKDIGSINDEDDYVPPQPQGRRKSAANMTLARSLLRNKPVNKPEVERTSGSLASFVGKKDRAKKKAFGTATATLNDFYAGNEENDTTTNTASSHKPSTIAEFLAAKKAAAPPNKTVSLADYFRNKEESTPAPAPVEKSEVEKQRALWS